MPPANGNIWYNPQSTYGGTQNWLDTPFVKDFVDNQVPQGTYFGYLTNQGLGGFDRKSQFGQGLYGRSRTGYDAAQRNHPGLTYRDYLDQHLGPNAIANAYTDATPDQRGESGVARNFMGRGRLYGRG
jgi:hypothetical protein